MTAKEWREEPTVWDPIDTVLRSMTKTVRDINMANGWFDSDRTVGDGIMLIVSEVAEALEAFRTAGTADQTAPFYGNNPKPEGYGSEMADVLIRLLDECDRQNIDLAFEFRRKCAYNRTRGYRHGGRTL